MRNSEFAPQISSCIYIYRFYKPAGWVILMVQKSPQKKTPYRQCMKPLVNNGSYLPYQLLPDPDFWTVNSMTKFAQYVFLNFLEERNFEQNHYWFTPLGEVWNWRYIPRKSTNLKIYFLLKIGIFQCHVSFQGCKPTSSPRQRIWHANLASP